MKLFLTILTNFVFLLSFWVIKYFVPDAFDDNLPKDGEQYKAAVRLFTVCRYNAYAIFGTLCYLTAMIQYKDKSEKHKLRLKYWQDVGIAFFISDIVDRLWFKTYKFTNEDIVMLLSAFVLSYLHVYFGKQISLYIKYKLTQLKHALWPEKTLKF